MGEEKQLIPFPEAFDGKVWNITHGRPKHKKRGRELEVPLFPHARGNSMRTRELAKIRFGQKKVYADDECHRETVDAAHEALLNYKINQAGIEAPMTLDPADLFYLAEYKEMLDPLELLQIGLKYSLNQPAQKVLSEMGINESVFETTDYYVDAYYSHKHSPLELAIYLEQIFEEEFGSGYGDDEEEEYYEQDAGEWKKPEFGERDGGKEFAEVASDQEGGLAREYGFLGEYDYGYSLKEYAPGTALWAKMTIHKPDRPLPLPAKLRYRGPRASDIGVDLRYPHRWCIDKKIFGRRMRKIMGGTVLVDCSGSMSLSDDDVYKIITDLPAATIALYQGGKKSGEGHLKIVAGKNRRARREEIRMNFSCTNQVDGPALRWLGKQDGPRFWVSDGYVTGWGEGMAKEHLEDAKRICKRYGIMRIPNPTMMIDIADELNLGYATAKGMLR